jgi:branched-chain amino acid transport system permease protein
MGHAVQVAVSILFDGIAYSMVLFVMAVGLSVTMGLMGVINLAHGAFAMAGGYLSVTLLRDLGVPFVPGLVLAVLATALASIPIERALYARIYSRPHLDQVLLTIGVTLMSIAVATYLYGPSPLSIKLPAFLETQVVLFGRDFPAYRAFIIVVGVVAFLMLWGGFERTMLGAKIRAAVDNRAMAEAAGVNTTRLFTLTFALGSGLAALGGALAIDLVGLTPRFAIQYLVLVLVVVSIGGFGTIMGAFAASLVIGVIDNAGRYLYPDGSAFFIYLVVILVLICRPRGLFGRA